MLVCFILRQSSSILLKSPCAQLLASLVPDRCVCMDPSTWRSIAVAEESMPEALIYENLPLFPSLVFHTQASGHEASLDQQHLQPSVNIEEGGGGEPSVCQGEGRVVVVGV